MREMNPEAHNSEARLTKALRLMAAASASGAPPKIGDALAQAFRRHHARRRLARRVALIAAALIITSPAVLLLSRKYPVERHEHASQGVGTGANAAASAAPGASIFPTTAASSGPRGRRPVAHKVKTAVHHDNFVPLPSYDPRMQMEDLRIVRLRLNGRSLRLVGAPVSAEIDDRPVLADFVIGQDGTPYAVRLLQQNTR